jgi:hypothetical protein
MPRIEPQQAVIRGVDYTILTKRMKKFDGLCDHPTTPGREIWIHSSLSGQEMLDTLIHELIHASYPDLKEDAVSETATDIATVLWDLGYRAEWDEE